MEEDIKKVEYLIECLNNYPLPYDVYISEEDKKAIENLLKEYRELEKFRDITLMKSNTKFANVIKDSIYFDYIPKEKVKNKIAELEKRKKYLLDANLKDIGTMIGCEDCDEKITLYKELLEE